MKKIVSLMLVTALASTAALAAYATDLTEVVPTGNTEVTATISSVPGSVSYIIAIPETIDFGALVQPSANESSPVSREYTVSATTVSGLGTNQRIMVYAKPGAGYADDNNQFYIKQTTGNTNCFEYDLYDKVDATTPLNSQTMGTNGYLVTTFAAANEINTGKVVFDQQKLYGATLSGIAGKYSGQMVFYTTVSST